MHKFRHWTDADFEEGSSARISENSLKLRIPLQTSNFLVRKTIIWFSRLDGFKWAIWLLGDLEDEVRFYTSISERTLPSGRFPGFVHLFFW